MLAMQSGIEHTNWADRLTGKLTLKEIFSRLENMRIGRGKLLRIAWLLAWILRKVQHKRYNDKADAGIRDLPLYRS